MVWMKEVGSLTDPRRDRVETIYITSVRKVHKTNRLDFGHVRSDLYEYQVIT